jgi:methyl-accepting chemotaxis protein
MGGVTLDEPRALGLPEERHRLSRGLIAYGIVGLVVAAIGLGAMVWVNGRIGQIRDDAEGTVARLATTMELAANVLHGASTTAQSFSTTVDQSAQAVLAAAVTITEVRSELTALEAQLRSVNILGATPLSAPADAVGRIAASMDGLDGRLSAIADSGKGNRDALAGNSTALGELADSTQALAVRLGSGVGQDSFGEIQLVIAVTLLAFAAWSFVPAAGALGLGVWLRRELGRTPGHSEV